MVRLRGLVLALASIGVSAVVTGNGQNATPPHAALRLAPLSHASDVTGRQVTVRIGVDRSPVRSRGPITLVADVTPRPGMHVYAPGQHEYESVRLHVAPASWYTVGKIGYPAGVDLFLPAIKQRVQVYEKPFRVTVPLTLGAASAWPAATKSGTLAASGTLTYQACDATVCYRPETVKLTWTVGVAR